MKTKHKFFLAKLIAKPFLLLRKLFGMSDSIRVNRKGINWFLDLKEGIDFSIFLLGSFEPSTISVYSKLIKQGNYIFDVGANIGAHTLHFAKLIGEKGKVFSFEPTNYAYDKLIRNVELNDDLSSRIFPNQIMFISQKMS